MRVIRKNIIKYLRKEIIMPRGNGTGPVGMGPMTGRAADFCVGYPASIYMNPVIPQNFEGISL